MNQLYYFYIILYYNYIIIQEDGNCFEQTKKMKINKEGINVFLVREQK